MSVSFDHGEYLSRDCWHCGKRINGGKHAIEGTDFGAWWRGPECRELHPECAEKVLAADKAKEESES